MGNTLVSTFDAGKPGDNKPELNPLDSVAAVGKSEDSDFIKNLVADTGEQDKNIMDVAPELDRSLIEEVTPPTSMLLVLLKGLSAVMFVGGVVIVGFFTLQLTDTLQIVNQRFDIPNLSADLSSKNQDVIKTQTDINFYRYLQAKAALDKFSYDADTFLQNYAIYSSSTVSKDDKDAAKQAMADIRPVLKESFLAAREKLIMPISVNLADDGSSQADGADPAQQFIDSAVSKLQSKAAELADPTDDAMRLDFKNYSYAASLINNSALRQMIANVDFDKLSDDELNNLIKAVDLLAVNDFSIIQKIKDTRIAWSDIIHEIDLRTIIADENYTKDNYESYGGIRYTSYSFDSESRQISLVGETKKADTTTFTTISNLIDSLNKSGIFEEAEMRSFSKSGDSKAGYTSSLRISFKLKN